MLFRSQPTTQIDPSKLHVTLAVNGKQVELNSKGLTGADFAWEDNHGVIDYPVNVGTYYITLTGSGLARLQADNPNFNFGSTGRGVYTISQAHGTATLAGMVPAVMLKFIVLAPFVFVCFDIRHPMIKYLNISLDHRDFLRKAVVLAYFAGQFLDLVLHDRIGF